MFILKRATPYLTPVLVFAGFEAIIKKPTWLYWLGFILLLIIFLSVRGILEEKRFKTNWRFLLTPLFLTLAVLSSIVFLSSPFVRQILVICSVVLIGLFLERLYVYFYAPLKYQLYSLENLAVYVNLISSFLFFVSLYGLIIFLSAALWQLTILVFLLTILLGSQAFWINKIPATESNLFVLIIGLIMLEIFWVVSFFPTNFYVNGLVLAIVYYILTGITRCRLQSRLGAKLIVRYLLIGAIMLVLILSTARWS